MTPPTEKWDVIFQDESREIASEYQGGLNRYSARETDVDIIPKEEPAFDHSHPVIQVPTREFSGSHTVICHINGGWTPYELVKDAISALAAMNGFQATPDTVRGSLQGQGIYTQRRSFSRSQITRFLPTPSPALSITQVQHPFMICTRKTHPSLSHEITFRIFTFLEALSLHLCLGWLEI